MHKSAPYKCIVCRADPRTLLGPLEVFGGEGSCLREVISLDRSPAPSLHGSPPQPSGGLSAVRSIDLPAERDG